MKRYWNPDDAVHGECGKEIERLTRELAEMTRQRDETAISVSEYGAARAEIERLRGLIEGWADIFANLEIDEDATIKRMRDEAAKGEK